MINKITIEKIEKYKKISERALKQASKNINPKRKKEAGIILDMAKRYINDAEYFQKKEDLVDCFAALNYAHGWIDTGSRLGIFNVTDNKIFIVK